LISSLPPSPQPVPLHVLFISNDSETIRIVQRTIQSTNDELFLALDLSDGLTKADALMPELAFVDITLGDSAGLAVVHHLRALFPNVAIFALTRRQHLDLGPEAIALGAEGVLVLPLSGDEFLSALSLVRARQTERAEHDRLKREAKASRRAQKLADDLSQLTSIPSRREAAERLALILSQSGAQRVLVYLPADEGSRQLVCLATVGSAERSPTFCEDFELLNFAQNEGFHVVRLTLERKTSALLLLSSPFTQPLAPLLDSLSIIGPQIAMSLALVMQREQTNRGAMKDPASSAYTFAYFVDVVGREIDKARRHSRRFALATLSIRSHESSPNSLLRDTAVEVSETVLSCVRDTDVLARIDDSEFYLLLPETGGLGAHACRRRVLSHLNGPGGLRSTANPDLDAAMGIATFPHDGLDLSQLLRVARARADACRLSPVRRLGLDRLPLPEILDALLWRLGEASVGLGPSVPRIIELPLMDVVGLTAAAISEAARSGETRVIVSQRSGMNIGAAARAALSNLREEIPLDVADISSLPASKDFEVLVLISEHSTYCLLGRTTQGQLRAVHSSDPVLADLLILRLGEAVGMRWID
jgi:GGDEF domain-containing protein/ActR/RegA family two-component response regulator